MIKKILAPCLLAVSSVAFAVPLQNYYGFYLQQDTNNIDFSDFLGGSLRNVQTCDRGVCGDFAVGNFFATVRDTAYNISFSGNTPTGFIGAGLEYKVTPVVYGDLGRGLKYEIASFEALGTRFAFEFENYYVVSGKRIVTESGKTTGTFAFDQSVIPVTPFPASPIPEPGSLALLIAGLPIIFLARRRRKGNNL